MSQNVSNARLFVSRMLDTLRGAPRSDQVTLGEEFLKDLQWFSPVPQCNGITMMHHAALEISQTFSGPGCLSPGCGGVCGSGAIPPIPRILQHLHHHQPLMVVAARLWGQQWAHAAVTLYLDNIACVQVLSSGV